MSSALEFYSKEFGRYAKNVLTTINAVTDPPLIARINEREPHRVVALLDHDHISRFESFEFTETH